MVWDPGHLAAIGVVAPVPACYLNSSHDDYDATRALQVSYNECYSHLYPGDLPSGRTTLVLDGDYGGETTAAVANVQGSARSWTRRPVWSGNGASDRHAPLGRKQVSHHEPLGGS